MTFECPRGMEEDAHYGAFLVHRLISGRLACVDTWISDQIDDESRAISRVKHTLSEDEISPQHTKMFGRPLYKY